jgi:pyrroline-5-carboxylate reductase
MKSVAFVGGGMMAEAIIRGALSQHLLASSEIRVGEPVSARRQTLAARYGLSAFAGNPEAVEGAAVVVLAVKPQYAADALASLSGRLAQSQLLISIMAGITIRQIAQSTQHAAIVRVMPNTPAQYGEGMSVWTATAEVNADQVEGTRSLLSALGKQIQVAGEHYIDMATALSGSGPGFVLLFIEALVDAGVQIGFARPVAEDLAIQTVLGTAVMARESGQHLAALRNAVTSPGGTTAAGLFEMEDGRVRAVLARAISAAYQRCVELGK